MSKKLSLLAMAAIIAGAGILIVNNNNGKQVASTQDFSGGVSTNVACEDIAATRGLVNTELAERKSQMAEGLAQELEAASNSYWEKRRALEREKENCESEALLADPCKDLFEKASTLANEILQNLDNGFDEEKFQEREQVKEQYDQCLKNPPQEETYPGKMEQCKAAFDVGNSAALEDRKNMESSAQEKHDSSVEAAELAHQQKMIALDALEKECEETKYERKYGSLPGTGIPVTDYKGGVPACTGNFPGFDPETANTISRLKSLAKQKRAGGQLDGFGGALNLEDKARELEKEMAAGAAKCVTDSDCGGPEPVCCNVKEVGRAFCSNGICSNEKVACKAEEVCAGKPASCLALIQVIEYQGLLIPTSQLNIGEHAQGCSGQHWHGNAVALDGTAVSDPNPDGCGYGTLSEKPAFSVYPPSQVSTVENSESGELKVRVRGGIFGN